MKLKTYIPTFDHTVKAIQFFRSKVKNKDLSELVEKVWSEEHGDCFVRHEKHKSPKNRYSVQYVVKGWNQYLRDGDWIVISSDDYPRVESDEYFKKAFKAGPACEKITIEK